MRGTPPAAAKSAGCKPELLRTVCPLLPSRPSPPHPLCAPTLPQCWAWPPPPPRTLPPMAVGTRRPLPSRLPRPRPLSRLPLAGPATTQPTGRCRLMTRCRPPAAGPRRRPNRGAPPRLRRRPPPGPPRPPLRPRHRRRETFLNGRCGGLLGELGAGWLAARVVDSWGHCLPRLPSVSSRPPFTHSPTYLPPSPPPGGQALPHLHQPPAAGADRRRPQVPLLQVGGRPECRGVVSSGHTRGAGC